MYQSDEAIIQNLKDAGCNDKIIQSFMIDLEQEKNSDGIKLLRKHRRVLLDNLHEWQKKIDCLDYLLYQMTKEKEIV